MKYSVFTVAMPEYEVKEVPAKLKEWGYDGVEWRVAERKDNPGGTDFWSDNKATIDIDTIIDHIDEAERIRDMTRMAGIEIPALAFYVECSKIEMVEKAFKAAALMDVGSARIRVPGYDGSNNYNDLFEQAVIDYKKVERIAEQNDVKALVEIHHGTIIPSASSAYRFASNFNPDRVGVILDPGNMIAEGYENWQLACELLGPYLAHVHAKNSIIRMYDTTPEGRTLFHCQSAPLRSGMADWLSIIKALKSVGYKGWISMEDFSMINPLDERLTDDLQFLKTLEKKADAS